MSRVYYYFTFCEILWGVGREEFLLMLLESPPIFSYLSNYITILSYNNNV